MKLPTASEIDLKAIETPLLAQLVREATEELNSRKTKGNHLLVGIFYNRNAERQVGAYFDNLPFQPISYDDATINDLHHAIYHGFFRPGRQAMNYINNEIFEPNGFERIDIKYKKK